MHTYIHHDGCLSMNSMVYGPSFVSHVASEEREDDVRRTECFDQQAERQQLLQNADPLRAVCSAVLASFSPYTLP